MIQLLKKNWIVAGAIIIFLISIAFFYLGVFVYYTDKVEQENVLAENQSRIDGKLVKPKSVASIKWLEQMGKRQQELSDEITNSKKYYRDRDQLLEKWFTGLVIGRDGLPSEGNFQVRYLAEKNALIRQLKDNKIIGSITEENTGESYKDEGKDLGFGEPKLDNLQKLQKRFWIQQELVADMLISNVSKCEKIVFPVSNNPAAATFQFGTLIRFNVTVLIANKDIPVFIKNILESHSPLFLNAQLKDIIISRVTDEIIRLPEIIELGKRNPASERAGFKTPELKIPLSRLFLEGEVLDFTLE